jgi:hypothetical protein
VLCRLHVQLVRSGDPGERVVMQFGKAEQDAFILDFNPTGGRWRWCWWWSWWWLRGDGWVAMGQGRLFQPGLQPYGGA